jgi:hypothetical protein
MNLAELRQQVEAEIEEYVYEVPPSAIGTPLPQEEVETQLNEFRASLVDPKWEQVAIRDTPDQMLSESPPIRHCILVANDSKGCKLYYDPEEGNFVLAYDASLPETFGVRGDAVGCFMAR